MQTCASNSRLPSLLLVHITDVFTALIRWRIELRASFSRSKKHWQQVLIVLKGKEFRYSSICIKKRHNFQHLFLLPLTFQTHTHSSMERVTEWWGVILIDAHPLWSFQAPQAKSSDSIPWLIHLPPFLPPHTVFFNTFPLFSVSPPCHASSPLPPLTPRLMSQDELPPSGSLQSCRRARRQTKGLRVHERK